MRHHPSRDRNHGDDRSGPRSGEARGPVGAPPWATLQRLAGNRATTRFVTDRRNATGRAADAAVVVQRAIRNDSNLALAEMYRRMVELSPTWAEFDAAFDAHPIRLWAGKNSSWDPETRTIEVCLFEDGARRDERTVRHELFFEMHNARNSAAFQDTRATHANPPGDPRTWGRRDRQLGPYRQAAVALAAEWHEWVNAAETATRTRRMTTEPERAGRLMAEPDAARFLPEGASPNYLLFRRFLERPAAAGHMRAYDRGLERFGHLWPGHLLVTLALTHDRHAFVIDRDAVDEFLTGRVSSLQDQEANPFARRELVEEAADFRAPPPGGQ